MDISKRVAQGSFLATMNLAPTIAQDASWPATWLIIVHRREWLDTLGVQVFTSIELAAIDGRVSECLRRKLTCRSVSIEYLKILTLVGIIYESTETVKLVFGRIL
jgi:hypothetical protein